MSGIMFWFSATLIFYVYLGYPILVALLAHLRKPLTYPADYFPTVTLIFAANNEERIIAKKLENLLLLDYPQDKLQILVADDGSADRTQEIAKSFQGRGVELVSFNERRGKLAALNDAVISARGEIFLFSDADNFFPPDALKEAVKYFQNSSIGAVSGGRNVIGSSMLGGAESLYWKYEEFIKRQESRLGSCVGVAGDLLALRKKLFISPPIGTINDDFYLALSVLKQGYRVIYAPAARSFHPVADTEAGEAERRARMVAGRYQTLFSAWAMLPFRNPIALWQIISHKYLRPLVPFAMITALIANLAAVLKPPSITGSSLFLLTDPYNQIFLSLQIIFYGIALIGMRIRLRGFIGKVIYLPAFLLNSNLAALRGFYRYVSSNQTVVWKKADR